jgi:hypothetical protein
MSRRSAHPLVIGNAHSPTLNDLSVWEQHREPIQVPCGWAAPKQ